MIDQALQKTEILFVLAKYYVIHDNNIFLIFVYCIQNYKHNKSSCISIIYI